MPIFVPVEGTYTVGSSEQKKTVKKPEQEQSIERIPPVIPPVMPPNSSKPEPSFTPQLSHPVPETETENEQATSDESMPKTDNSSRYTSTLDTGSSTNDRSHDTSTPDAGTGCSRNKTSPMLNMGSNSPDGQLKSSQTTAMSTESSEESTLFGGVCEEYRDGGGTECHGASQGK